LDGTEEDRASWRSILAGARANDVRMAVLSNEPEGPGADRVREDARAYGIEHVILSGVTGIEKPEAEAFLEAAADWSSSRARASWAVTRERPGWARAGRG